MLNCDSVLVFFSTSLSFHMSMYVQKARFISDTLWLTSGEYR